MTEPTDETVAARGVATAALQRLRDAAGAVLTVLSDAAPVAPHHLLTLRAVAEGATSPSDVAAATGRHASSASRVLDQLVDLDLVDRRQDEQDRRQVLITLTPAGREVVATFDRLDDRISDRMLAGFDADDAQRLATYLDRIADNAGRLVAELDADPDRLDEFR